MPQADPSKTGEDGDDAADFGDEAAAAPAEQAAPTSAAPLRAMPDYGDVVDADEADAPSGTQAKTEVKGEQGEDPALAPKRKDAVWVSGVERLNRSQLAEIFEIKKLPEFLRLDTISDSKVVMVFSTDEDAAAVLASALEGWRDVPDDGAPGPGLWRAKRGMMDFRQATIADVPDPTFRRQHRSGKQVREFRMFSALTHMDKQILDREQEQKEAYKRAAPEADDADEDGQPKKKRKTGGLDLLEQMANSDKRVLVKQEANGELDDLPEFSGFPDEDDDEEYYRKGMEQIASGEWKNAPRKGKGKKGKGKRKGKDKGSNDRGRWSHDDRDGVQGDEEAWGREGFEGKGKGRMKNRDRDGGNKRKLDDSDDKERDAKKGRGKDRDAAGALGIDRVEANQEEIDRRKQRAARFAGKTVDASKDN